MVIDDTLMLLKISRLYYYDNLTQAEIAKIIGISRPLIVRALQKAREDGLVEIIVHDAGYHSIELEKQLKSKFSLDDVMVVPTVDMSLEKAKSSLFKSAANYVSKNIKSAKSVGISWGKALYQLMIEFPKENYEQLRLIPLFGGMGSYRVELHANQIAFELSKKLNCTCVPLLAPAIVESEYYREMLLSTPYIANFLKEAREVEIALVGIGGNPLGETSSIQEMGYLGSEEKKDLMRAKAVGDSGGWFFDANGNMVDNVISSRVIGVSLEDLKKIPKVIAIAEGLDKVRSIIAALKGGFINVFITDDRTASEIVNESHS